MAGGAHGGRPSSWLAVGIMIAGFTVGGAGLTIGPSWPVFWLGAAIVAAGAILALTVGIFADVVLDEARVVPEIVDYSPLGATSERRRGGKYGDPAGKPTRRDSEEMPHG